MNYELSTDKPTDQDIGAPKAEMQDPRFDDNFWKGEIDFRLETNQKSKRQALAKCGFDVVTDTYLPENLTGLGILRWRVPSRARGVGSFIPAHGPIRCPCHGRPPSRTPQGFP